MKNLTITFLFVFSIVSLYAQEGGTSINESKKSSDSYVHKGLMYLGGTIAFNQFTQKEVRSNNDYKSPTVTYFDVIPEFGYLLSDKFAIALGLGYKSYSRKSFNYGLDDTIDDELIDKSGLFIINPKVKVFRPIVGGLYCNSTLGVHFGFGKEQDQSMEYNSETSDFEVVTTDYKQSEFGLSFRPALLYFFSNHFALTFSYGNAFFNSTNHREDTDGSVKKKTTSYGIDLSLNSIQTGLLFTF